MFVASFSVTDNIRDRKIIVYNKQTRRCEYTDGTPLSDASLRVTYTAIAATTGLGVAMLTKLMTLPLLYSGIGDSFSESILSMWKSVTGTESVGEMMFMPDAARRQQAVEAFYDREGNETGLPYGFTAPDLARMIRTPAYWKNLTDEVGYVVIPEMPDPLGMVENVKRLAGFETGRVYDLQVLIGKLDNIVNGQGGMVANVTVNGTNGTTSTELSQFVHTDGVSTILASTVDMIKSVVSKQLARHRTEEEVMTGIASSIRGFVNETGDREMSPMITTFGEYINDAYNNTDLGELCRFIGQSIGRKIGEHVEFKCSDLLRLYNVSTVLDTCMDQNARDVALQNRREEWSNVIQNMMENEQTWRSVDEVRDAADPNPAAAANGLVGALWTMATAHFATKAKQAAETLGPVAGRDAKEVMMAAKGDISLQNSPRFERAVAMIAKLTSIITPIGDRIVQPGGTLDKGFMHDECMSMTSRVDEYAIAASNLYGSYMEKEVLNIVDTELREMMRMGHLETVKITVSILVCVFEASSIGMALNHKKCKMRAMYEYMAARGGCKLDAIKAKTRTMAATTRDTMVRAKDKATLLATTTKDAVVRAKDNMMGGLRRMAGYNSTTMMFKDCCTTTL